MKKDLKIFRVKKGWVRVVEAFVAILLITGIVLSLLGGGYVKREDPSPKIYEAELGILRDIQNNEILRNYVLNATIPSDWNNLPQSIKDKIILDPPNYLECQAKVCTIEESCILNNNIQSSVYARTGIVSGANFARQLKIFCWEK